MNTAKELSKLGSIPQVNKHANLIKDVQDKEFWDNPSIRSLEDVREALRDLIKFIEKKEKDLLY